MILMLENGNSVKLMATVFIFGSTETDIREISNRVSNTAMENNNFPMGIATKETTIMASHTATASIIG